MRETVGLESRATGMLFLVAYVLLAVSGVGPETKSVEASVYSPSDEFVGAIPLIDLGTDKYLDRFQGGLYPDGENVPPVGHTQAGMRRAAQITTLDVNGRPDPDGRYVLLSIGMSNASSEFCGAARRRCAPESFMGQALNDPRVETQNLAIVNGAMPGQVAENWDDPGDAAYEDVKRRRLTPQGLSELQVQAVWLKIANRRPLSSLPALNADAYRLERSMGAIVRALKSRYPNLHLVFVSSRTYAGYSATRKNPEPFAYESGFAVKWLIEAQILQESTGYMDSEAGDLALSHTPWIGWGPYLWVAGENPRSDGLVWLPEDVGNDGVEVSSSGIRKVGRLMLEFYTTSPFARCWFVGGEVCAIK